MVPGSPPRSCRIGGARLLRLERQRPEIQRRAHHLHGYGEIKLDMGSGGARLLLAPVLLTSARSELRQPARVGRSYQGDAVLARYGSRWIASGRDSIPG